MQEVTALVCDLFTGSQPSAEYQLRVDKTYWRKATVAAAVGVLYECAKREKAFTDFVGDADCQLTMVTSDDRRPSRQPVSLRPLANLLLSHPLLRIPPILLIARYIKLGTLIGVGGVSLSVMSAGLLKHVASPQNIEIFSIALESDTPGLDLLRRGCTSVLCESISASLSELDADESEVTYFVNEYFMSYELLTPIVCTTIAGCLCFRLSTIF